jgi:regulator of cell morphogenesis and NO signaling
MGQINGHTDIASSVPLEEQTIGQMVAEHPGRAQVFEKFGIDYCCGGKKVLTHACSEKDLDTQQVLQAITAYDASHASAGTDWTRAPLTELADHIITAHHDYLRASLPRLSYLTARVRNAHSDKYPALAELDEVFNKLRVGLETHTMKEETVLFPCIKQLDRGEAPSAGCSVSHAVTVMEAEHDEAGDGLKTIRELTNDFTPPPDTCNTHRALLFSLQELESDMHQHVHKENSILFPRAVAREKELLAA